MAGWMHCLGDSCMNRYVQGHIGSIGYMVGNILENHEGPMRVTATHNNGDFHTAQLEPVEGPLTFEQNERRFTLQDAHERWERQKRRYDEDYTQLKADIRRTITSTIPTGVVDIEPVVEQILTIHSAWCDKHHGY